MDKRSIAMAMAARRRPKASGDACNPIQMAHGGLVDEIMKSRRPEPSLEMSEDVETDMEPKMDFSAVHEMDDAEHGNPPTYTSSHVVGQILEDRKRQRR